MLRRPAGDSRCAATGGWDSGRSCGWTAGVWVAAAWEARFTVLVGRLELGCWVYLEFGFLYKSGYRDSKPDLPVKISGTGVCYPK